MSNSQTVSDEKRSAEDRALDRFSDMLISKIEGICGDWKKPWFTEGTSTTWPRNLDGREYNGMNALVLMMHCEKEGYKLPVFMTFDRVAGLNYKGGRKTGSSQVLDKDGNALPQVSVNKGEKSFPVFLTTFTVVDPDTHEKINYDDYKQLSLEERAKYRVFPKLNVFNVFNVSQTNIEQSRPELFKKLQDSVSVSRPVTAAGEQFSFPAMDHMIEHNEWICPIKPTYGDDAYYSISKKEIVIPEKRQFKSGESFYANLAHEMSHSTGAEDQLNRLKPSSFGSVEYAREELTAELSAALFSQRYGLDKCIKEDSVPYLKNWLASLKEDPSYIKTVLTDVKKASGMIIDHVEKVQDVLDKEKAQTEGKKEDAKDQSVRQPEATAAKSVPDSVKGEKFAIICASTGGYVSQVSDNVVRFDSLENAMRFETRDEARAMARECKAYVPDLRFTVKPVAKEQNLGKGVPEKDSAMRLSDLVVELRGEQRTPWLAGKVDGEPVVSEQITFKEFQDYIERKLSAEDLGLVHFKQYLDRSPEENLHSGRLL